MHGKALGNKGEKIAADYLQNHNYTITVQNFRWARGEIDIIVQKPGMLVFVEVKTTHATTTLGAPETWVRSRKQQQIAKTALRYLQTNEVPDVDIRFDVIGITYSMGTWYIAHREDAFSL